MNFEELSDSLDHELQSSSVPSLVINGKLNLLRSMAGNDPGKIARVKSLSDRADSNPY